MFDTIYRWAKLVAVCCVLPITVFVCLFLHSLTQTTKAVTNTVNTLPATVDIRVEKLQTEVLNKIDTVQDKLLKQVDSLTTTTDKRIASIQGDLFKEVGTIRSDLFAEVRSIHTDLNLQFSKTNGSVDTLVTAYANIPKQLGDRYNRDFDRFFNCGTNQLCLQGQASDTMFAVRTASRSTSETMLGINKTLPKIENHVLTITNTFATDVPKITGNINAITSNIDRLTKPRWYDRLIGYGLNGVVIYRNLNPATNLSIKGAQAATSLVQTP